MKKITTVMIAVLLTLTLVSCAKTDADTTASNGRNGQANVDPSASAAAFDRYNAALVELIEGGAYDISIYADLRLSEDDSLGVGFDYQFKDSGTDCEYYARTLLDTVYYSGGVKTTVAGDDVTREEISYDKFIEQTADASTLIASVEITRDDFEDAVITEKNGRTTVVVTRTGMTELPDMFSGYAVLFGFDQSSVTDIVYDDAVITIELTSDDEIEYAGMTAGVSYVNADGGSAMFKIAVDIYVNALGDNVKVNKYNG